MAQSNRDLALQALGEVVEELERPGGPRPLIAVALAKTALGAVGMIEELKRARRTPKAEAPTEAGGA